MQKFLFFLATFGFAYQSLTSRAAESHQHRHHGAHVHGSAKLAIAFEKLEGQVEFQAPAESIVGFEYQPKSPKDQKTLADAKAQFQKIEPFVQFDPKLQCQAKPTRIEMVPEKDEEPDSHHQEKNHGEHSDFSAIYQVQCKKTIVGSKLKIDFTSYDRIQDLDVTILADQVQKSAEVKKKAIEITIE